MKLYLLIVFCFGGQLAFSQTVIQLIAPKLHQEEYQFVNPSDTPFVEVGHQEDMGVWYGQYYKLKTNIPDGEYFFYVNDTLKLKAYIKSSQKDSTWTYYYRNGKINKESPYKNGKLNGETITFYRTGVICTITKYNNDKDEYTTDYYESGNIQAKHTRNGDELLTQEFPDIIIVSKFDCNSIKPGTYHVTTDKCADLVLLEDGTCHFKKTSQKKKITGIWEVSHCTLFLSFDAVRKKSPIEAVVGKNGKQPKKVKYKMTMSYKIHNDTLIAKEKSEENFNYNCGVYTLQLE